MTKHYVHKFSPDHNHRRANPASRIESPTLDRSREHYELVPDVPGSFGRLCSDSDCAYCVFMRARGQTR